MLGSSCCCSLGYEERMAVSATEGLERLWVLAWVTEESDYSGTDMRSQVHPQVFHLLIVWIYYVLDERFENFVQQVWSPSKDSNSRRGGDKVALTRGFRLRFVSCAIQSSTYRTPPAEWSTAIVLWNGSLWKCTFSEFLVWVLCSRFGLLSMSLHLSPPRLRPDW